MATFNKIFILVLLSIVVSINVLGINGDGEPSVEIEEVWGTATIPAGKLGTNKEEFTCVAANVPKHGKFVWKLGDKVMENTNAVQDTSEDGETVLSQTYNIDFTESGTLEIINALNNKKISCSYVETDSFGIENTLAESASVNLEVKVQDFPKDKNLTFSNLQIGQPANLSLKMDIYPQPKNEDYDWTIYDKSRNTKIEVKTDVPNNAEPGYAAEIKLVDGITYEAKLMIKSVPDDINSKTIYLSIKENQGGSEEDDRTGSEKIYFEVSAISTNQMNIGIWIILAVIVVIIIICIVYCIYNGNCCKKKSEKEYEQAATNDV